MYAAPPHGVSPVAAAATGEGVVRPDLEMAAAHVRTPVVTRFAPSPTGYLHLGHVVNAIYVWGLAQALGGSVLLRIEDHDRVRCRPAFEGALLDDLAWLGFLALPATSPERRRQSDRAFLYSEALASLRHAYQVYACDCSRREVGGPRYTGRCRAREVPDGPGAGLRVCLDPGVEPFHDLLLGHLEQSPAEDCGDLLIRDRDGHWTYQFAVTVDDSDQGVTLVVRGADLLDSTGRQLRLARMLKAAGSAGTTGLYGPIYVHHPLIYGEDGRKLSKSTGATGVRALRRSGMSSSEVIGRAAAAAGLLDAPHPLEAARVGELFARAQVPRTETHAATHPLEASRTPG